MTTTLPSLYSLVGQDAQALAEVDQAEDEEQLSAALERLAQVETDLRTKAANVAMYIRERERWADACEAEERLFADRKRMLRNKAGSLRSYLLRCMHEAGIEKVDTERFSVAVRTNPPKVDVLEPSKLPSEFTTTTITVSPDKKAIIDHYKTTGEVLDGCEISQGSRLAIS